MTQSIRVVAAVVEESGRYLLQQRSPHRDFPWLWESPGGKVEPGETDQQALRRELLEELGIENPRIDIHRMFLGMVRTVVAIEPDGRYLLATPDARTGTGVRNRRVSLKTLEREYEVMP